MERCSTCKYWTTNGQYGQHIERDICQRITLGPDMSFMAHLVNWVDFNDPNKTWMVTASDFGCTLHEPTKES